MNPSKNFNQDEMSHALSRVNTIKKKYEMYLPLDPKEEESFNKYFRAYEVYSSNHIEGNDYTLNDTRFTLETGIGSNGKKAIDTQEIMNINRSLNFQSIIIKEGVSLTENLILEVHRLITSGTLDNFKDEGNYKRVRNWVGEAETSSPQATPKHMKELVDWYYANKDLLNPITLSVKFKYRFLRVHPFTDGNGRTSRWLLNLILKENGLSECVIWDDDKEEYYKALELCDLTKGNYECDPLLIFICNSLVKTYQKKIDLLEPKED